MQITFLKSLFNNRILQSLLFGAVITAVVALVWNVPLEKFKLEKSGEVSNSTSGERLWFFEDFNNDGNTEKLRCSVSSNTFRFSIVAYNHRNEIVATPHFKEDYWSSQMEPAIKDVNNDGTKDFLFFSLIGDSICFSAVDVLTGEMIVDHLFFMQIERFSKKMGIMSTFYPSVENNGMDKDEILFSFDSGYGLYPRGLFKLNLKELLFTIPEKTYSPYMFAGFADLNNDGKSELLTKTYAPSNINFDTKYPDNQTYIAVYTSNLEYLFPPIAIKGEFSNLTCHPDPDFDSLFYVLYQSKSESGINDQIMVASSEGKVLKRTELPDLNYELMRSALHNVNAKPYLFINNHGYYHLTPDLKNIPANPKHLLNDFYSGIAHSIDLNSDGIKELISYSSNKFFVHNLRHKHTTSVDLPVKLSGRLEILPFYSNGTVEKFMFLTGASYFFFTYTKNDLYFLVYFIYLGFFIFFSGITFLLLYLQKKQLEKNWHTEKQLSELQFNAVKNQLHPHFLFNSLNSVAFMINNGQKDEAYDFLTVNSRMIQRVMDDARVVQRPLNAEIQFTKDYLKVQEHRFKDKFRSEFHIHPEVEMKFSVPKMCIHTYVENAIKHGFRNTKKDGLLQIDIEPLPAGVSITVTDNGMGRTEAEKYYDSSGHGLKTMEEFYRLFEKYHGYKIQFHLEDRNPEIDGGNGLKVLLKIESGS